MNQNTTQSSTELKVQPETRDILQAILDDHKPLKRLIKIMKDDEKELSDRQIAFEEFAPLLTIHAKSEEQVLYVAMKSALDLREEGLEGDVEHGLADQLVEEIKRTTDEDLWSARVKVLAELVEHHIEEEEDEMFPEIREATDAEQRKILGAEYLNLRAKWMARGGEDTVQDYAKREPNATH